MKSNRKKRILAAILCMVMVLTSNISALAEGEGLPDVVGQEQAASETAVPVPEVPTENAAATQPQSPAPTTPETVPTETQGVPSTTPETTPAATPDPTPEVTPAVTPEVSQPALQEQGTTQTPGAGQEPAAGTTPETIQGTTPAAPETTVTPGAEGAGQQPTPGTTPETTPTVPETTPETTPEAEEKVLSEATELTQEFKDASGQVIQKITAKLPAGAFEAETSQITMEVRTLDRASENHIKNLMEKRLPQGDLLGDYMLYDIRFKVNGQETDSLQPITITFEKSGLEIKDVKKANVFYYDPADPAVAGDQDELIEITQRSEMIENLQASGQGTDKLEEYDLSSIEIKEENRSEKITLEGRNSTIYGCYVEYTPVLTLNFENEEVTVAVSADEAGIIPDDATLKVVPITAEDKATKAQYEEVEKQIQEKVAEEEKEVAGFLAYDISFVDAAGNEMEPNGKVKVSINYKKAELPKEVEEKKATDAEVTVYHLEENAQGDVKQVVDMAAEQKATINTLATTEGAKVQNVEVMTESFSVYTVVWVEQGDRRNRPTATLHFVNENGRDISSKLGVGDRDKEIEISGTGNLGGDSDAHKDLNAIGEQYSEKNGYYYEAAHLDDYDDEKIADDISYNPNDNNGYDWHYLFAGSWHGWKKVDRYGNNREVDVYLVYTDEKPESLSHVPTVDSTSQGVSMKMIDLRGNGESKTGLINGRTTVNFGSNSGYGYGNIKSGLLNSRITNRDGFPTVKNDRGSLGRLFNEAKEVNHLFRQDIFDESGYFEYSSFENYAYLGDDSSFTVYNQIGTPSNEGNYYFKRGNFMPYNEIRDGKFSSNRNLYDENGNRLEPGDHRYNERLYKTQGDDNFQFGMMLEAEFTQQRDGMATHNGTTSPMVYEFNGDDDLWVFIDDVLVLDIGGVHDAHSGSIDFSTGDVVWYDCTTGATPQPHKTTLKAIFQEAGVLPSGNRWTASGARKEFKGNTFADYTTDHSFKMYYFERGAGASNLHVKFNLPTVPKDSVNIQKVVQNEHGQDANYADDIDFLFEIEVDGQKYANEPYEILNLGHQVIGEGTTDKNAQFTLKHNQIARFSGIEEDKNYRVKELGAYLDGYEVEIGGTVTWTPDDDKRKPYPDSGELNVGQNSTAVFINKMLRSATLNITKELADPTKPTDKEFQIELKLGDDLYKGTYTIGKNTFKAENGIIKLKAGQTATITGLPYGVKFEARELMDGSYLPTYGITGKDVANIQLPEIKEDGTSNGISSASAQINGDTCTLTVTNKEILVGAGQTSVSVKKNWEEETMAGVPIPEYVDVYLYKDENQNGEYDEGTDTEMAREFIRLNNDNGWSGSWDGLPGDTDYVVKEVYPPGYELIKTESDNSFDDIGLVGGRNTPNNNTVFNIGVNNLLLVKETGNDYFLWSPIDLKLDAGDISNIAGEIKNLRLEGSGNLDLTNLSYRHGVGNFQNISLEQLDDGWKLSFNGKSTWAMFWTFQYHRTQSITLTNSLDKKALTSVKVEKRWAGDSSINRPHNVTVQLYKNGTAVEGEDGTVELNGKNNWNYTFENLLVYTVDEEKVTKNIYTVKEIKIGDKEVDENGRAQGYQSSVETTVDEDGITKFIITNAKDWQIVKVSENSDGVGLSGAVFQLIKKDAESSEKFWGKSEDKGVVKWYQDAECKNPYSGVFKDGTYTLKEIKSPGGYVISEETWTISIKGGIAANIVSSTGDAIGKVQKDGKDTYYFKNTPIYELPSTGGTGIFVYTIGGTLLLMAAALLIYRMKREEVLKR